MNLGPLEEAIRQVVKEEVAAILVTLGRALQDADALDLVELGEPAAPAAGELRECRECGSTTTRPCSAQDCGWPTGKPPTSFDDALAAAEHEERGMAELPVEEP